MIFGVVVVVVVESIAGSLTTYWLCNAANEMTITGRRLAKASSPFYVPSRPVSRRASWAVGRRAAGDNRPAARLAIITAPEWGAADGDVEPLGPSGGA